MNSISHLVSVDGVLLLQLALPQRLILLLKLLQLFGWDLKAKSNSERLNPEQSSEFLHKCDGILFKTPSHAPRHVQESLVRTLKLH